MRATAIIGDIHGDARRLALALRSLERENRRLVFVGDYINRGPQSREVLDHLAALQDKAPDQVVLLRGNHEVALLRWLRDGDRRGFLQHGGLVTVRGYLTDRSGEVMERFRSTFPYRHLRLVDSTRAYFEEDGLFVSHAGFDPSRPDARDWDTMTMGARGAMFHRPLRRPQDLTVFGHYVQRTGVPHDRDGLVCLDTGCGTVPDAPLTVLLLPEREFAQF